MLKLIIIVIFLGWFVWFAYSNFDKAFGPQEAAVINAVCTQDIQFCPDGTMVERSGPACTFALCP